MFRLLIRCLPIVLLLCAACGPGGVPALVPTLMELPTDPPPTHTPPATLTRTPLPTWTSTVTPSASPTRRPTDPPTLTPTVTPSLTITPTPTFTPSATSTVTTTPTPTEPAQALSGLVELALRATILPATFAPPNQGLPLPAAPTTAPLVPPTCASLPTSGFLSVYVSDPTLSAQLGCPMGTDYNVVTAVQTFERGMMIYVSGQPGTIYALFNNGAFRRYTDTYVGGADPERSGETPPAGFLTPLRGFLKVWNTNADVRGNLGWAITEEAGNESRVLQFERGRMIFLPQRNQTVILFETSGADSGAWRVLAGGA